MIKVMIVGSLLAAGVLLGNGLIATGDVVLDRVQQSEPKGNQPRGFVFE